MVIEIKLYHRIRQDRQTTHQEISEPGRKGQTGNQSWEEKIQNAEVARRGPNLERRLENGAKIPKSGMERTLTEKIYFSRKKIWARAKKEPPKKLFKGNEDIKENASPSRRRDCTWRGGKRNGVRKKKSQAFTTSGKPFRVGIVLMTGCR